MDLKTYLQDTGYNLNSIARLIGMKYDNFYWFLRTNGTLSYEEATKLSQFLKNDWKVEKADKHRLKGRWKVVRASTE